MVLSGNANSSSGIERMTKTMRWDILTFMFQILYKIVFVNVV